MVTKKESADKKPLIVRLFERQEPRIPLVLVTFLSALLVTGFVSGLFPVGLFNARYWLGLVFLFPVGLFGLPVGINGGGIILGVAIGAAVYIGLSFVIIFAQKPRTAVFLYVVLALLVMANVVAVFLKRDFYLMLDWNYQFSLHWNPSWLPSRFAVGRESAALL